MKKINGFTLIELMVTLFVALALIGVGVPSFNSAVKNARLSKSTNLLVTSLHRARSEALKRSRNVIMCANNASCNSDNWENGWILFVDENEDSKKDSTEELIFQQDQLKGTTVRFNGGIGGNSKLGFSSRGTPVDKVAGTFSICDDRNDTGKAVVIANSGRTRYDDDTEASC